MEGFSYCPYCCTTELPKRVVDVKIQLNGKIAGTEKEESKKNIGVQTPKYVCSVCGKTIR